MVEASVKVAQAKITAFVEDNEKLIHLHQRAETCLTPDQIHKWTSEVATVKTGSMDNASGVVHEFLTNAGQAPLLTQLQLAETAFCKGMEQMKQDLQTCILLLGNYSTMYGLYPNSHKGEHRTVKYDQWLKSIAEKFDLETCQRVHQEFTILFESDQVYPNLSILLL